MKKNKRETAYYGNKHKFFAALVLLICALAIPAANCPADQIKFQPNAWNADDQHVIQNGVNIAEPAASVIPGSPGVVDFFYIKDSYNIYHDQYFSGAGVSNPQIYQHVYAYTLPVAETFYTVKNTTGYAKTFLYSREEIGNKRAKRFRFEDYAILNGALLLTADGLADDNLKGLLSSFNLLITREIQKGEKIKSKKILKGSVTLIGQKNGNIKVKTTGAIKNKHITSVSQNGDIFKIEFDDEIIPYSTRVKIGRDFTIVTTINSKAVTLGLGTGGEVIFGPGDPKLPLFLECCEIPEPTALLLLMSGGGLLALRRKKQNWARLN